MRHTKIIATLGPATHGEEAISDLLAAGVDVFRLNFSHGTHESHGTSIARIRAAAELAGRTVAILADLSGPKIRTGPLRGGMPIRLEPGSELRIAVGDFEGEPGRVSTTFDQLPGVVHRGDALLLDDGRIQLRVEDTTATTVTTRVVDGGELGEHKGINIPGGVVGVSAVTPKDLEDLAFVIRAGVDLVALSFVQSAADIRLARDAARAAGAPDLALVAKLERPEAVERIEEILAEADAVMVARGDLGLELPLERVPRIQKQVTRRARALGVPVIVATQVLESMVHEPRPTRAEVSDAANAVDDGVDAIMLAGETAVGAHPVRAVKTLDLIIRDAESMPPLAVALDESPPPGASGHVHLMAGHGRALCEAAATLAARGEATAIVALTRGGKSARALSALRPRAPIYAVTDRPVVARQLALVWGVVPVLTALTGDVSEAAGRIGDALVARGSIPSGSVMVLVSISPELAKGPLNFLKLQRV